MTTRSYRKNIQLLDRDFGDNAGYLAELSTRVRSGHSASEWLN